jgi:4a-hydroxytetrahydrobiopterin dehydratase
MHQLSEQECTADTRLLSEDEVQRYLELVSDQWQLAQDGKSISRKFGFDNYYETLAFVNVVAMIAHQQDHHPDMTVTYNTCIVAFSTHSVGGLSPNDFICAAKTDGILNI